MIAIGNTPKTLSVFWGQPDLKKFLAMHTV